MEIGVGTMIGGVVSVVWRSTNVEKIKVEENIRLEIWDLVVPLQYAPTISTSLTSTTHRS